jgi:hypothetical protein
LVVLLDVAGRFTGLNVGLVGFPTPLPIAGSCYYIAVICLAETQPIMDGFRLVGWFTMLPFCIHLFCFPVTGFFPLPSLVIVVVPGCACPLFPPSSFLVVGGGDVWVTFDCGVRWFVVVYLSLFVVVVVQALS